MAPRVVESAFNSFYSDVSLRLGELCEAYRLEIMEHHNVPVIYDTSVFKALYRISQVKMTHDDLPSYLKENVLDPQPVITHIFSISFDTQRVPKIWKTANGRAILTMTNISPLDQLRQISVNDHLMSWSSNELKPVSCFIYSNHESHSL